MKSILRLGTRGSRLALTQVELAAKQLIAAYPELKIETVVIKTTGDANPSEAIGSLGSKSVFTDTIEKALQDGAIDAAVHSLKDLPSKTESPLCLPAVLERGDPRDCLVSRSGLRLGDLDTGAIVGTSSPRRKAVIQSIRPDLVVREIRGNVDTRIRKVKDGLYDAAVLALAGLERLGLRDEASQIFGTDEMLPSPGQAAIALQCRSDDDAVITMLSRINHQPTYLCVSAEREAAAECGVTCRTAFGAYAKIINAEQRSPALSEKIVLDAVLSDCEGEHMLRGQSIGDRTEALDLGRRVAEQILALGGKELLI